MQQTHEAQALALGRLVLALLAEGREPVVTLCGDRPCVDQGADRPMLTIGRRGRVRQLTADVA